MARCITHNFDDAVGACRSCGSEFCRQCLVFPHGSKRPPLCVGCALAKAGVRTQSVHRSLLAQRSIEAGARDRAAAEREVQLDAVARRARGVEVDAPDEVVELAAPGHAMAGMVRLLLLLVVVAMVGLGALLQVGT